MDINAILQHDLHYDTTDSGILLLNTQQKNPVYDHPAFRRWQTILRERMKYYTETTTIAGKLAHMSYRSITHFNGKLAENYLVDIGCGDGRQLAYLNHREHYIGIDRDLTRLEILKSRYPEAIAIHADATHLPFRTGKLQYFYSTNALEHLWSLPEVIYECGRCLGDSGELVAVFPTEGGLWTLGRRLFSQPHFTRKYPDLDFDLVSHIEHCNTAPQILRTLETFFITKATYLPTRIPTVYLNALTQVHCRPRKNMFHSLRHFTDK